MKPWWDDAACRGEDPVLFDYIPNEDLPFAQAKAEDAISVCSNCNVVEACRDDASQSDREWTVRAGLRPILLVRRLRSA
jgi:hypothetical protein